MAIPAPFVSHRDIVRPEWIDHNGHMNMGFYLVAFDQATDGFLWELAGLDDAHRASRRVATFTLEGHILYLREVREGDPLRFETRLVDFDEKRIHYFHEMFHDRDGYLAATNELLTLHVSEETRRAAPIAPEILDRLAQIKRAQATLPTSPQIGRHVSLRQGRPG